MTVFEAYITNLGKYAEGQLVGETLKFPATTEEVQSLLKKIGVDGVRYEEFFITAFDGDVMGLYDDKDGQRQYEWGHYGSDRAALEQDFAARVQEYQRLYNVGVKQTEAPGLYKYYSTQRPVDIGTFPKPHRNAPDEIVNYDQRIPVENGSFLAWGHLTYTRPLTKRQASDYELRPAPDNPDRPRSIREQMKTAAKLAEADRGHAAPKKNAPDRGDR